MPIHEIDCQVKTEGRVLLEGLPVRAGQTIRLILPANEPTPGAISPPAPRSSRAGLLRGTLHWYRQPTEPAADPSE